MTKTVIIYNFKQICEAMKAASKTKKKICISSPYNAASYMGPFFFKELVKAAEKLFPKVNYFELLNCSNDVGLALKAIKYNIKNIEIECNQNITKKIKNICKKKGIGVNNIGKKRLDLKNISNVYEECLKLLNN